MSASRSIQTKDAGRLTAIQVLSLLEGVHGITPYEQRLPPLDELVSCILSQHAADAVSFPTFFEMRRVFGDWGKLACADRSELANVIRPAGLANQKAKTIQAALAAVHNRFGAYSIDELEKWPLDEALNWLMSVPGIGPKTASIVMCFAFDRHSIPLDVHVFRVMRRVGLLPEKLNDLASHHLTNEIVPQGYAFRFHMALLKHGRTICRPTKAKCDQCPLTSACLVFKDGVRP